MMRISFGRIFKSDWMLVLISAAVLLIYLFYTVSYIAFVPYPGFSPTEVADGWLVSDSLQPKILIDDIIVRIDELTYNDYLDDRLMVLFDDYPPGEVVSEIETIDGRIVSIQMPEPTLDFRLRRLIATIWFFPFWAAGTAVLLFVRPRDVRWRLLIAFMYLTALWAFLSPVASWHFGGSRILVGAIAWFMAPVFIHLHLAVPSPLFKKQQKIFMPVLYAAAISLAVLELFQVPPAGTTSMALVAAIMISISLLGYRSIAPSSTKRFVLCAR